MYWDRMGGGGFQFLLILSLWVISFHAAVVFVLGKDFLFKYALGHCELPIEMIQYFQKITKRCVIYFIY